MSYRLRVVLHLVLRPTKIAGAAARLAVALSGGRAAKYRHHHHQLH